MAERSAIAELLEVMSRLRDPEGGCPWDREQSFRTIAPYTIEEAYEVADAIVRGDPAELKDELGDLLFQVVFHAQMARESGLFDFDDVARAIVDKMVRRHPHVFADARVASAEAQTREWEAHKAAERRARGGHGHSALDGVARGLSASRRALKLQRRAAQVGFDWPGPGPVVEKLREEIDELDTALRRSAPAQVLEDELGDLLFTCVNLGRHLGVEPELALRRAQEKFEGRFRRMEKLLDEEGRTLAQCSLDELEAAWQRAKGEER